MRLIKSLGARAQAPRMLPSPRKGAASVALGLGVRVAQNALLGHKLSCLFLSFTS
jgi:hypothetical protein